MGRKKQFADYATIKDTIIGKIIKKELVKRLAYFNNDRNKVAKSFKVSRRTIMYWIVKYDLPIETKYIRKDLHRRDIDKFDSYTNKLKMTL